MHRLICFAALTLTIACGGESKLDRDYTDCIDAANLADLSCRCDSNAKLKKCTEDCATGSCSEDCLDKADNRNVDCDNELTVALGTCDSDHPDAVYLEPEATEDTATTTTTTEDEGTLDCPEDTTTGS